MKIPSEWLAKLPPDRDGSGYQWPYYFKQDVEQIDRIDDIRQMRACLMRYRSPHINRHHILTSSDVLLIHDILTALELEWIGIY